MIRKVSATPWVGGIKFRWNTRVNCIEKAVFQPFPLRGVMLDKMRTLLTTAVLLSIPAPPSPRDALTKVAMTVTVSVTLTLTVTDCDYECLNK